MTQLVNNHHLEYRTKRCLKNTILRTRSTLFLHLSSKIFLFPLVNTSICHDQSGFAFLTFHRRAIVKIILLPDGLSNKYILSWKTRIYFVLYPHQWFGLWQRAFVLPAPVDFTMEALKLLYQIQENRKVLSPLTPDKLEEILCRLQIYIYNVSRYQSLTHGTSDLGLRIFGFRCKL